MHKSQGFVLAALLAVTPLALSAQRPEGARGGGRAGGGPGMRNAASYVLEHKTELKVTEAQEKQLKALVAQAKEIQEKNKPLLEEMRAAGKSPMEMTDAEREHYRPAMEAMRNLSMQLMQILTPEQLESLRALNPMGGRGPGGPGGAGARPQR